MMLVMWSGALLRSTSSSETSYHGFSSPLPRFDLTVLDFLNPPVDVRDLDTWLLFGSGSPLMFAGLEWRVMMVARLFSRPSSIEPRPRLGSRGPGGEASAPNGGLRCSRAS